MEKFANYENEPIVHVTAQYAFHTEAYIIGNRKGLERLREAIDKALAADKSAAEVSVNDGEYYDLHVIHLADNETIDRLALPYTTDYAKQIEHERVIIYPWDLVLKSKSESGK